MVTFGGGGGQSRARQVFFFTWKRRDCCWPPLLPITLHPAQVAAKGLIEAVCGLPPWAEMTVINRETMRMAGAATALVPLLSSGSEPVRIAAFTITAGWVTGHTHTHTHEGI